MKNFNTIKKEKEEDVRNGPVVVYKQNGRRSIVPKLTLLDQEVERGARKVREDLDKAGYGD